jgi:hypothetical protein
MDPGQCDAVRYQREVLILDMSVVNREMFRSCCFAASFFFFVIGNIGLRRFLVMGLILMIHVYT